MNNNFLLNDKLIRAQLKLKIHNQTRRKVVTVDELAVDNGRAVADVVALFKNPHCYEIKSELDSLRRLDSQAKIFSEIFPKVTLVTAPVHFKKALEIIPSWWGVIVVNKLESGKIIFNHHRKSKLNQHINKTKLLSILWNSKLHEELVKKEISPPRRAIKVELAEMLSMNLTTKEVYEILNCHIKETKYNQHVELPLL